MNTIASCFWLFLTEAADDTINLLSRVSSHCPVQKKLVGISTCCREFPVLTAETRDNVNLFLRVSSAVHDITNSKADVTMIALPGRVPGGSFKK